MAREHGRIFTSIWSDEAFRRLSPAGQHLYLMLATDPSLSYAGVADWRPNRLLPRANGWTSRQLDGAAAELVQQLYILVDADTEEALVRSFVRSDGLMKQRHMGVSMARAHGQVASNMLRGVMVYELVRLHGEDPELKGWQSDEVQKLLAGALIDPATYPLGHGPIQPPVQGEGHPPIQPPVQYETGVAVHPPSQPPSTTTTSTTTSTTPKGGDVEGGRYVGAGEAHDGTTPHCQIHPGGTTERCRACGDARRAHQHRQDADMLAAIEARQAETRRRAEDHAAAIADCGLCDDDGYLRNHDNIQTRVCDHTDRTDIATAGAARVREALAAAARERATEEAS